MSFLINQVKFFRILLETYDWFLIFFVSCLLIFIMLLLSIVFAIKLNGGLYPAKDDEVNRIINGR